MKEKNDLVFHPVTRENWEAALMLKVKKGQQRFVPTVAESLASAYIKPWDEALDPYVICRDKSIVGFFYISYTPDSKDNYWIGGFMIDKKFQGKGYGKLAFAQILEFIPHIHTYCELISLTVEKDNLTARKLYETFGFCSVCRENKYGELIFEFKLNGKNKNETEGNLS